MKATSSLTSKQFTIMPLTSMDHRSWTISHLLYRYRLGAAGSLIVLIEKQGVSPLLAHGPRNETYRLVFRNEPSLGPGPTSFHQWKGLLRRHTSCDAIARAPYPSISFVFHPLFHWSLDKVSLILLVLTLNFLLSRDLTRTRIVVARMLSS